MGQRIREMRIARNMTQVMLSAASGLPVGALSAIENGRRTADETESAFLADALGCAPSTLRGEADPEIHYRGAAPQSRAGREAVEWFARYAENATRVRRIARDMRDGPERPDERA